MAVVRLRLRQIKPYAEAKVKQVVRESAIDLRNRLVSYSPVGEISGGTFKSNWQPPILENGGYVARVVNTTQNYGLAITFGGRYMPPSWQGRFRSRYGLPERWPVVLAVKETQDIIPSIWRRAGGRP